MESSHDLFGTQQCYQLLLTRFIFDELRCQLQVEQCSCSAVCVVYITNGFENSCRTMLVIAWVRRHTVCQRLLGFSSGRQCPYRLSVRHVRHYRHKTVCIMRTEDGRVAVRYISRVFYTILCNIVNIRIIVSVLRCIVDQHVAKLVVSFEVLLQSVDQLCHGDFLVIVYQLLDSCHGVCIIGDTCY